MLQTKKYPGVIYCLTSPSGKKYVGQTINLRLRVNKYKSIKAGIKTSQTAIGAAIKKYGFSGFTVSILLDNIKRCHLNKIETFFIRKQCCLTTQGGYNIKLIGGQCPEFRDIRTRDKISKSTKGKPKNPDSVRRSSATRRKFVPEFAINELGQRVKVEPRGFNGYKRKLSEWHAYCLLLYQREVLKTKNKVISGVSLYLSNPERTIVPPPHEIIPEFAPDHNGVLQLVISHSFRHKKHKCWSSWHRLCTLVYNRKYKKEKPLRKAQWKKIK